MTNNKVQQLRFVLFLNIFFFCLCFLEFLFFLMFSSFTALQETDRSCAPPRMDANRIDWIQGILTFCDGSCSGAHLSAKSIRNVATMCNLVTHSHNSTYTRTNIYAYIHTLFTRRSGDVFICEIELTHVCGVKVLLLPFSLCYVVSVCVLQMRTVDTVVAGENLPMLPVK